LPGRGIRVRLGSRRLGFLAAAATTDKLGLLTLTAKTTHFLEEARPCLSIS
jgi:hypothetical protein